MREDWENRTGRIDPIFPSRRHDHDRLLEREAIRLADDAFWNRFQLAAIEILVFLRNWWDEEAVAPAMRLFKEYRAGPDRYFSGDDEDRAIYEEMFTEDADLNGAYSEDDLIEHPSLRLGLEFGRAQASLAYALEVQMFIHDIMGNGERGPVMARLEREAQQILSDSRHTLRRIAEDGRFRAEIRRCAADLSTILSPLDDLDDPAVAMTWPSQRKDVLKACNDRTRKLDDELELPPPDPPMPAEATALIKQICDHRLVDEFDLAADDALRFRLADVIEEWDPAWAMFLRLYNRGEWNGIKEPEHWYRGIDEKSRFQFAIPGLTSGVGVAAISGVDLYRWVEDVGPYVKSLSFDRGMIGGVIMTPRQLREHGERVMAIAPIWSLNLDLNVKELDGLAELLATTPTLAPIKRLEVEASFGFLSNEELVRALFSNPHLTRLRVAIFNPPHQPTSLIVNRLEFVASWAVTEFLASRQRHLPKLMGIGGRLAGREELVTTKELRQARDNEWWHLKRSDSDHAALMPITYGTHGERYELPEASKRLIEKYGELPWLRTSDQQRAQMLNDWWNMDPDAPFEGTPWWRDE